MKTVLFVPGGMEDINSRDYKSTIKAIESKGFKVKFVQIIWKRKLISDWVTQLDEEYKKYEPKEVILAGFSWGSMTAFISATKRNPSELWLFSFSPFFSEDMHKLKKSWLNEIGHRRVDSFKKLTFKDKAKLIKCKTLIFAGETETSMLKERCKEANKLIDGSKLIIVSDVGHDIANPAYIETINNSI